MNNKTENKLTDQQLVKEVLRGNTYAFGTLIKNTEGLVAHIVYKMIFHPEDRKDIAQDVYLKAYKNLPNFKFEAKLSTWIGQITYNTCLNFLEKKKIVLLQDPIHNDEMGEESLEMINTKPLSISDNDTEILIFKEQLSEILQAEIEKLSPIYKTLITLFHQAELSYEEIAQITMLPEGTIKNYLFRARKTLKDNLLLKYKKEEL